jgi:large subunit ribosomal protein L3
MKFVLGTKVNMTQIFDDKGMVHPVTVLKAGPMTVTAIKSISKDGYTAVQVGFGEKLEKNINKPEKGHMKSGNFRYLKEFEVEGESTFAVGDTIDLSTFSAGDMVTVSSISKGKGFQGVVKRYGFKGGPRSHGQKHSEREPGSIGGAGRDGGRVAKGKRMAGRMGGDRITTKGLTVVGVKPETGEIFVRGAIAGRRGTLVEIRGK